MSIYGKHTYCIVYQFRRFVSLSLSIICYLEEKLVVRTKHVSTLGQFKRAVLVQLVK